MGPVDRLDPALSRRANHIQMRRYDLLMSVKLLGMTSNETLLFARVLQHTPRAPAFRVTFELPSQAGPGSQADYPITVGAASISPPKCFTRMLSSYAAAKALSCEYILQVLGW